MTQTGDKRTLAELRESMPNATFTAVKPGTLPRNHVGFFTTADGVPYVHKSVSPSERYGIKEVQTFIDYESADAEPEATDYTAFDRAFGNVDAFAVLKGGEYVARIAFKYGNAVTAFVQVWGAPMQRGRAFGGGYDRLTAAVESAVVRFKETNRPEHSLHGPTFDAFRELFATGSQVDNGYTFIQRLERSGFTVLGILQ